MSWTEQMDGVAISDPKVCCYKLGTYEYEYRNRSEGVLKVKRGSSAGSHVKFAWENFVRLHLGSSLMKLRTPLLDS